MEFYNFKTTIYENRVGSTMNDSSVICHIYGAMENPHVFSYIYSSSKDLANNVVFSRNNSI